MSDGKERCQRCGESDYDRRTLWMACFYDMSELNLPFTEVESGGKLFHTLRVCKDCRADWMGSIQLWFKSAPVRSESPGSGIFIRENGAVREVSEEEWRAKHPDREPVRVKR